MRHFKLITVGLLLISCLTKPVSTKPELKNETETNLAKIESKQIPKTIPNFIFRDDVNSYFRNDVDETAVNRIIQDIKKGNQISDNKSNFSQQAEIIESEFKRPYWPEYFPDSEIKGSISYYLRVAKDGTPNIIIIIEGINKEVDRIFVEHLTRSKFKPAIHAKSKKPVNSWLKLKENFL